MKRAGFLAALFFLSLAQGASQLALPYFSSDDLTPYWEDSKTAHTAALLGEFKLKDQNNKDVISETLRGHISLVNFFFATCPKLCPMMMQSLNSFQKSHPSQAKMIHIYSLTVEPETDSPAALLDFGQRQHLDLSRWSLLTGDKKIIYSVGKDHLHADGSIGAQKSEESFIHTRNVYLIDQRLNVRGIYDTGNSASMKTLAEDIEKISQSVR